MKKSNRPKNQIISHVPRIRLYINLKDLVNFDAISNILITDCIRLKLKKSKLVTNVDENKCWCLKYLQDRKIANLWTTDR